MVGIFIGPGVRKTFRLSTNHYVDKFKYFKLTQLI